jgi:hypothetical protein
MRDAADGGSVNGHQNLKNTSVTALLAESRSASQCAHDPEKWAPVFGQDHAPIQ